MPDTAAKIIARLSKKADSITDAIERRQMLVERAVAKAEKDLFSLLIADLSGRLVYRDGKIDNSSYNLALLARIDAVLKPVIKKAPRTKPPRAPGKPKDPPGGKTKVIDPFAETG